MKKTIGWILVIVSGLLLLCLVPGLLILGRFWLGRYRGMMGFPGMMGGRYFFMRPFGLGGMLLGWLVPAGIFVLLVVGAVLLFSSISRPASPAPPANTALLGNTAPAAPTVSSGRNCPNCGKPAQADWTTCPYCGKPLEQT